MPLRFVRPGTFVSVPLWEAGQVTCWTPGRVMYLYMDGEMVQEFPPDVESHTTTGFDIGPTVLVSIPGQGPTLYYPYSLLCDVCRGRDDVTCHQCPRDSYGLSPYSLAAQ